MQHAPIASGRFDLEYMTRRATVIIASRLALIMTTRVGYFGLAELHSVGLTDADWESPETAQEYWADADSARSKLHKSVGPKQFSGRSSATSAGATDGG
jgi:hypothetical protein